MLVGSPSEKGSTRITYSFETAALPVMDDILNHFPASLKVLISDSTPLINPIAKPVATP
jgi:hypothetical protein